MRRVMWLSGAAVCLFTASVGFGSDALVWYDTTDLGGGVWEYTYDVQNVAVEEGIEEFTIWFDFGLYDDLTITTPDPPAAKWSQIVIQPEPYLQDDGFYDAVALDLPIAVGETTSGFSVRFDWLGTGQLGAQFYEIIDPVTFETIDSGWTVPEPGSAIVMGVGGMLAAVMRRKRCK